MGAIKVKNIKTTKIGKLVIFIQFFIKYYINGVYYTFWTIYMCHNLKKYKTYLTYKLGISKYDIWEKCK